MGKIRLDMSDLPIVVSGAVSLNEVEIGKVVCANDLTSLNITTADNTDVVIGDTVELMRDTTEVVSVTADEGITIKSVSGKLSIAEQYGSVIITKIAANTWWLRGCLVVVLVAGITALLYNNTVSHEAVMLINWIK